MNRAFNERDEAEERLVLEQEASECTLLELEEVQEKLSHLQGEHSSVLEKVAHLESEEHQDQIIRDHRSSSLGWLEMALACKVGFDLLKVQLPNELKDEPNRLRFTPIIAPHLDFLSNLEREGGGYDVGESEGEDGDEERSDGEDETRSSEGAFEATTKELGESSAGRMGEEVGKKADPPSPAPGSGSGPP